MWLTRGLGKRDSLAMPDKVCQRSIVLQYSLCCTRPRRERCWALYARSSLWSTEGRLHGPNHPQLQITVNHQFLNGRTTTHLYAHCPPLPLPFLLLCVPTCTRTYLPILRQNDMPGRAATKAKVRGCQGANLSIISTSNRQEGTR